LLFLSDGVFAIAMTLLVFALLPPELIAGSATDLPALLWDMRPRLLSFIISFLVVATYWTSHQRIFQYVVRTDGPLTWLNLLFLLCIAFQPVPTAVLGAYTLQPTTVVLYATTLAITGLVNLSMWLYATTNHRMVRPDLSPRLIRHHMLRAASAPAVVVVSIPIAQFNPLAAQLSWL